MKLENPQLTLEDFINERNLYDFITKEELETYIEDEDHYNVIKTERFIFLYRNDGVCFFNENDDIGSYKLDDPSFFEGINILTGNIENNELRQIIEERNYYESDFIFSDDDEALKWEGDFNGENIANEFMLNSYNGDGYAGLVGIYIFRSYR